METLDTLQVKTQPSFQESVANGFYLLEMYNGNLGTDFRAITADMAYQLYISSNEGISESTPPLEGLDPNDVH